MEKEARIRDGVAIVCLSICAYNGHCYICIRNMLINCDYMYIHVHVRTCTLYIHVHVYENCVQCDVSHQTFPVEDVDFYLPQLV